jgi:ADP-ribose diphosphatase
VTDAWEQVGPDRTAYQGFVRVVHRTLRLPDGREAVWDMLDAPATATVLPLTVDQEVVLVRQFRAGPMAQVLSLPGGLIDEGEEPVAAAVRELREETGYAADRVEPAASIHANFRTRPGHTLVAHGCRWVGEPQLDDLEDCQPLLVDLPEFRRLLRRGDITTAEQGYLALDFLGLL